MKTITFSEAADELGCSRQYVHQLCKQIGIEPKVVTPRLSLLGKADLNKLRRHFEANKKD